MASPYASPVPQPDPGTDQRAWLNADPIAGFWDYLRGQGLNALDPVSKFAQGRYQQTYNTYFSDAAKNPNLGFYDYLQDNPDQFDYRTQYASLDPVTRGDTTGRQAEARARWVTPR